jgi:TonB family protein
MTHGSQEFFAERDRFEARLSSMTLGIALALLVLLFIVGISPLRRVISNPEHFGFEGPDRYVHRIEFEQYGPAENRMNAPQGRNYVPRSMRGGGRGKSDSRMRETAPEPDLGPQGPGDEPNDLLARALRRSSSVPIVLSENLIFEKLVRPDYPEEARRRNIEGRFSVIALIDTTGHVVETQVQGGDRDGLLEQEAEAAVRLCVIRPYRVAGVPREIVARFPFNFYLKD